MVCPGVIRWLSGFCLAWEIPSVVGVDTMPKYQGFARRRMTSAITAGLMPPATAGMLPGRRTVPAAGPRASSARAEDSH